MTIGEKIYNLRTKANISQETMGIDLGVSRQAVSKWETNQSTPDLENLKMIANYFNIPLTDLIDDNVDKMVVKQEEVKVINKLTKGYNVLFKIALILSIIQFACFALLVFFQNVLAHVLRLGIQGEHTFVFPVLDFIGLVLILGFIIFISLKVRLNKNVGNNSIAFEIVSIVLCAVITNTYLALPGLTSLIFKNFFNDAVHAMSYAAVRSLVSNVQPYVIIISVIFVTAMTLKLAVKSFKNK